MADAEPAECRARARGEQVMNGGVQDTIGPVARGKAKVQPKGIESQAQPFDAESGGICNQDSEHSRVQVQVQMAVDVIERQAGGAELLKLSVDFLSQLPPQGSMKKIAKPDTGRMIGKFFLPIYQSGNAFLRQRGMAAEQS